MKEKEEKNKMRHKDKNSNLLIICLRKHAAAGQTTFQTSIALKK